VTKLLEPGIRLIVRRVRTPDELIKTPDADPEEYIEVECVYLQSVLTWMVIPGTEITVNYTGWVMKDVETGEFGVMDPNLPGWYFKGESPNTTKI